MTDTKYRDYESTLEDVEFHVPATRMSGVRSVYLAGKISRDPWRDGIIPGWSRESHVQFREGTWSGRRRGWAITKNHVAVPRFPDGPFLDYTGPYWVCSGEHCGDSSSLRCCPSGHAMEDISGGELFLPREVCGMIRNAIKRTDLVFCWINSRTGYGTLMEIGYAKGLGRLVVVATPKPSDHELRIVLGMADAVIEAKTPAEGWAKLWAGPNLRAS